MKAGLILFAHGARDPRWAAPFEAVLERVKAQRPDALVRLAFLELMAPSLEEAARALVDAGCGEIVVQPMFLGTGGHLRRDLPLMLGELDSRFPQVRWTLRAAIGEAAQVIEAMAAESAAALGAST